MYDFWLRPTRQEEIIERKGNYLTQFPVISTRESLEPVDLNDEEGRCIVAIVNVDDGQRLKMETLPPLCSEMPASERGVCRTWRLERWDSCDWDIA